MPTRSRTGATDVASADPSDRPGRRRLRADARLNHERVLAAAVEVFTEKGLGATIAEVADRAGVGKATVYRSYPTKTDLVHALARPYLDWFHDLGTVAAEAADEDAYGALESLIVRIAGRLARDRLMIEVLGGTYDTEGDSLDHRFDRILAAGRAQGTVREDAVVRDLHVLVSGVARSLIDLGIDDPEIWCRYARLTVAALRPDPVHGPGAPVDPHVRTRPGDG